MTKKSMRVVIATSSRHKEQELSRYFKDIGLKTEHIFDRLDFIDDGDDYICVREQTVLYSKKTGFPSKYNHFEEVTHSSTVTLEIKQGESYTIEDFNAKVDGFIFVNKKTDREDIYNWDDIFVSSRTMRTYQEMKDEGIKNSARDIAFAKAIEKISHVFHFDKKVNLNFNPTENDEVISFEPFIQNLFENNKIYKVAYQNPVFKNIVNSVINSGLFIRRASDRKEKNYWLPGLNAGIPLTPKRDELHELTFMFHDIMHFIFPDVMVVDGSKESKNKYIISRMMSEAFTLVLADMLFIDVLKNSGVEYDYAKRKIYPVFENCKFEITKENISKIKDLLWANVCFALTGSVKELIEIAGDGDHIEDYISKYQRFFQEDFRWTNENYKNIVKSSKKNRRMCETIENVCKGILPTTENYIKHFSEIDPDNYLAQVKCVFEEMFSKLAGFIFNDSKCDNEKAFSNAVKRYYSGQLSLFFKFETLYNNIFLEEITSLMRKDIITVEDLHELNELYAGYVDKLEEDNYISKYLSVKYKNICPIFEPFYVFYNAQKEETFKETIENIIKGDKNV